MKILITGGAGFIGSHLVDELVNHHDVYVYDNFDSQVHRRLPNYLNNKAQYIVGDMRDYQKLKKTILENNIDIIYHLAAAVGVGQSMYEVKKYYDVNIGGTANLLDILAKKNHRVKRLIVASSMSTYGEGKYKCKTCGMVNPSLRPKKQFKNKEWELKCKCGEKLIPMKTDESVPQECTSFYALTKKEQEKMCMLFGKNYDVDTTALRFFNVYGSRQALSNPYTGVCAIFATSLLCGNSPVVFEDGKQSRDFVHVKDICQALILAMNEIAEGEIYNVGSGESTTIKEVAEVLRDNINKDVDIKYTEEFRNGDIRHCFSDISKIRKIGFKPKYSFKEGIISFIDWVKEQEEVEDKIEKAREEMEYHLSVI